MLNFLRVLLTRRHESKPVEVDRRHQIIFPQYRAATRTLQKSIVEFDEAVTRAMEKKK